MVNKKIQPINSKPIQIIQNKNSINLPKCHSNNSLQIIKPKPQCHNHKPISIDSVSFFTLMLWQNIKNK